MTTARNELFDEQLAFGQFKPTGMNSVATVIPAKPSVNNQNDDKNGNSDDFDFSKMRMFDEGKVGNIWGKSDEDSAWGGLFSQFLPQLGANSSLNNSNSKNDSSVSLTALKTNF